MTVSDLSQKRVLDASDAPVTVGAESWSCVLCDLVLSPERAPLVMPKTSACSSPTQVEASSRIELMNRDDPIASGATVSSTASIGR
jgi:hypothetical protein